jgi:glycosyltransferase involved in cell wall biosynthesis
VGVDLDRFLTAEAPKKGSRKTILFVGIMDSWHWYKRVDLLIRAHAKLLAEGKDYELHLVGRGDLIPELQALAKELGSDHRIKFLGSPEDDEIPAIFRSADLFVLPSPTNIESFGIVLLEAMASHLPAITSTACAGSYVITESGAGLLYHQDDYADLAEKMEMILSNEELARSMADKGSIYVLDYDWKKIGARILRTYDEVLGRLPASGEHPA